MQGNADTDILRVGGGLRRTSGGEVEANRSPSWESKLLYLSGLVGGVLPSLQHQTPEVDARSQILHFVKPRGGNANSCLQLL